MPEVKKHSCPYFKEEIKAGAVRCRPCRALVRHLQALTAITHGLGRVAGLAAFSILSLPAVAGAASPGSLVPGFGSHGTRSTRTQLFAVAVEPNGDIVAAGQAGGRVRVERYSPRGQPRGGFSGPSGYARAVAVERGDKIVIAGSSGGAMFVERLRSSLRPDSSFGSHGIARAFGGSSAAANAVGVMSDGSIVAAGAEGAPNTKVAVARLRAGGSVLWSKVFNFGNHSVANGMAIQRNGKIVLVGSNTPLQQTNALLVRLNGNGSPDGSFRGGAFTYHMPGGGYTALNAVTLQSDGKIVAGGIGLANSANALFLRLNGSGSFDGGFGRNGVATLAADANVQVPGDPIGVYGIAIARGGRIVGAGNFENTGVEVDAALWGLNSRGSAQAGFGHGRVVRAPSGRFEACAVAVRPDGSLLAVGDTVVSFPDSAPCSVHSGSTGFVARYAG